MEEDQQEASMPLVPIDSFSYSWLVNFPSLEASIDDHYQTYEDSSSSFIEMDPRLPPSRRFFINKAHESSFKFDNLVSFSDEDHSLVHADELFRDGYVVPYRSKATSAEATEEDEQSEPMKIETHGLKSKSSSSSSCRKLRRVSKWVLLKYLDFFTPLCRRLRRCSSAGSPGSIGMDTRIRVTTSSRSRVYSDETTLSPRISVADDYYWRRSCDSESSIYEAVLHCKKSFEK
ncbi:hypothetical protein AALP_AA8G306900 [Arabis alpina]|uniref:Membrane-associated kinase regulator 6 n=1 Tax=Arabis alpina TaxID=50452 RepID=A0A087GAI8_ARAAL|nr:hypothetical protein AALP_AA8G306900 [Arabis alpina]